MKNHELKAWPEPFILVAIGVKRYEVRRNDRGFAVGHTLTLREWDPLLEDYTGRVIGPFFIVCMTSGGSFGLPEDMCVLGIRKDK